MKHLKRLLWITTLMILVACSDRYSEKEKNTLTRIEQVWTLSDNDLDSAVALCDSLRNPVYRSSEYTRKKFDLLDIRLRYKRDMPATLDSIKAVTAYMKKHGTPRDIMRAYYYLGGIYDDLNDSPKAVEYALKSLGYLKDGQPCDTAIAQMCYSMLSSIYRRQHNSQEAISMALEGLKLKEECGTTECWDIMDVAMSYDWAGDKKNCMIYINKAYQKLQEEKNYRANLSIIAEMMYVFAENKGFGKVDTLAAIIETIPEHEKSRKYNYAKGVICEARGELDSAIIYYERQVQLANSTRNRQAALSHLFCIYRALGDSTKAMEYALQYQNGVQELYEADQQEWTRNAKGMYEYQRDKEEEDAITKENAQMKFWGLLCICLLLCGIAMLAALHFWHRKKLLEDAIGKDRKLHELKSQVQDKSEKIQAKEQALAEMEQRLAKIEEELHQKQALAEELLRQSAISEARSSMEDVTGLLEKTARNGKGLNEEEWRTIISSVNAHYPDFRSKVAERMPRVKEEVMHTCYLMKLGMTNQQIEALMQCAHQTAWNRIRRVREAMGQDILP